MKEIFADSVFFSVVVSLLGYELGVFLKKKTGLSIFNPLLIAIVTVIAVLLLLRIDYGTYETGGVYLDYFLTPSTVALAVPLYRQIRILKKYSVAISLGIVSGVLASLLSTLALAAIFHLTHIQYVTLLPKSITTAIGMGMSEEFDGMVTITVAVIVVTGIIGNMVGEFVCKVFHIDEKISVGLALGTSSHAIGTAKAMELGEVEGAMSSLSIVAAGLLTVLGINLFALIY